MSLSPERIFCDVATQGCMNNCRLRALGANMDACSALCTYNKHGCQRAAQVTDLRQYQVMPADFYQQHSFQY